MSLEDMIINIIQWLVLHAPLARISRCKTDLNFSCFRQQLLLLC